MLEEVSEPARNSGRVGVNLGRHGKRMQKHYSSQPLCFEPFIPVPLNFP